MDDILDVGIGGHFLGRKSTRAFSRSEVWRPQAFQRGTFEEFAGRPLAHEAAARAREILAAHEVEPLPEDADRHIDDVITGWAARAGLERVTASNATGEGAVARPRLTYLSDDDRAFVHEQAVRVLEDIGIGYNTPEAIELLAEAGADVDAEALTAKLPWELVERCLATCPSQVRLAARDPRHDVVVGDGSLTFCADGTATYMLDDLTGRRRGGLGRVAAADHAPVRRPAGGGLRLADHLGPRSRSL